MSRRRWLGWEPTQTVTYRFDHAGRRVGETITREPEWDDHERAMMQALTVVEADACSGCGLPKSETLGVAPAHFEVDYPWRCGACDAMETKMGMYREVSNPRALRFVVRRKDDDG